MVLHIVWPEDRKIEMKCDEWGYFKAEVENIQAGTRYFYMPDGEKDYADPASHSQPEGVHGPSEVVDHNYTWSDGEWKNPPLREYIMYEIHVGTFSQEGTFEAIIPCLDDIADTGINAIEIMPVSQFPGKRNWGYDGVFPYAPQNTYGGPGGLKKLVDACHQRGIAVIMDVVYNHLGPEGNYLPLFAPYFTHKYTTPWGDAMNFDDAWSDGVRDYFCGNALFWFREYHIDALRMDAVHQMYDFGAIHVWEKIEEAVRKEGEKNGRNYYLIAESDLNNPKLIENSDIGGYGFDAQWLDDFHHSLYTLLYKGGKELYVDFGKMQQLMKAYTDGFVHSGEFVSVRKRKFGRSSAGISGDHFIVFLQNHDQVGNDVTGSRLSKQISFDALKVGSAAVLLSPYMPLFFMGEEYGEDNMFAYFIDHTEKELIESVQKGRINEFAHWGQKPPDPESEKTFTDSKIDWSKRTKGKHKQLLEWNKALIKLRKTNDALQSPLKGDIAVNILGGHAFSIHRRDEDGLSEIFAILNLSDEEVQCDINEVVHGWQKILDSGDYPETGKEKELMPDTLKKGIMKIPAYAVGIYSNGK
jgi:maltooligosyltrehalose trehalohydrolase